MHYRLYHLDDSTGRIRDAADILAEDDREAIRAGHEACTDTPFEIWCRSRRVFSTQAPKSNAA
ncbi:MAG TPA: hypothetical protein VKQ09_09950 [Sphingomonas sp.]|nr:hypothetical protein [Sphingomonas sp.]